MMLTSGLHGPYRLSYDEIHSLVGPDWHGVYALGHIDHQARFCITFAGNATADLRTSLLDRIGTAQMFKMLRLENPQAAFEKVCEVFHDFHPPGNFLHPERPQGTSWQCPRCVPAALERRSGWRDR